MAEHHVLDPDGDLVLVLNPVATAYEQSSSSSEDAGTFKSGSSNSNFVSIDTYGRPSMR